MRFFVARRNMACALIMVGFLGACDFRQITEERPVKLPGEPEAPADIDNQQPVVQPPSTRSSKGLKNQ